MNCNNTCESFEKFGLIACEGCCGKLGKEDTEISCKEREVLVKC